MEFKADGLCRVCGDKASGKHYGVPSCDGCRGFFKRSIRRGLAYQCKESGTCVVDVTRRNQCQACRFKKCLAVNMKRDAVQHERAPRASLTASQCSPLTGGRRHGFGFASHGGFFAPAASVIDFPAYQLIYPQPTFPFQFGIKPHSLGLPHGLGLRIFNCPGGSGSVLPGPSPPQESITSTREGGQASGSSFQPFRRADESKVVAEERLRTPTSAEEEEVTSSEEAREAQTNFRGKLQDGNLNSDHNPMELPMTPGSENIYEFSAKLLFLTVKWARSIPSFLQLSFHDQSILLEDSWSDLFILSAAQWTLPIDEDAEQTESDIQPNNIPEPSTPNGYVKWYPVSKRVAGCRTYDSTFYHGGCEFFMREYPHFAAVQYQKTNKVILGTQTNRQRDPTEGSHMVKQTNIQYYHHYGLDDYLASMSSASIGKHELLEKEARRLKETIARFTIMRVDHTEYACLKTLSLFKSEATGLRDRVRVEMLQDQTHIVLHDHCTSQDSPKARFGKLLMLLSSVNVFSKDIIEELLFRKTVGNISIERVVIDMLKNTYNG